MKDDENNSEFERGRHEKVQGFQLQMNENYSRRPEPKYTPVDSYSNPGEARRRREISEIAAAKNMRLAHKLRDEKKGRKNKNFFRLIWFCMVFMAAVLSAKYIVCGVNDMFAVGRKPVSVTVEIPQNATHKQVARVLHHYGAIKDASFFQFYEKITKSPKTYSGGSYQITTGMDYEALINSIKSVNSRVDTVKITFTEGMNAVEIAGKLEKSGVCSANDALKAFNSNKLDSSYDFIGSLPNVSKRYYKLEGYLFPDTYEFTKHEDANDVAKKIVDNCSTKLTKQIREKAKEKGMTVDQMIVLASMIQAEAADKNDMLKVSSVFHNRLESGRSSLQHLDSDPTMYYPFRQKSKVPANIQGTYKSRYDTYTIKGLPAGAICSPGMDAINAALNPASTRYYYFCHDKNSKAYYAKTLSGHEVNLKKAGLK